MMGNLKPLISFIEGVVPFNDIKKLGFYLEECKRMNISILGPDINESFMHYSVNKSGKIRFGLGAIKGVGASAAEYIISQRKEKGNYKNLFDFEVLYFPTAFRPYCPTFEELSPLTNHPHYHPHYRNSS